MVKARRRGSEVLQELWFWREVYAFHLVRGGQGDAQDEVFEDDGTTPLACRIDLPLTGPILWRIELDPGEELLHTLINRDYPDEPVTLGSESHHAMLPILRWEEARALAEAAEAPRGKKKAGVAPCFILPLLLPVVALTRAEEVKEARVSLAQSWTTSGLLAPAKVARLVEASCFKSAVRWSRVKGTAAWVTDAKHSLRKPGSEAAQALAMLFEAFGAR